MTDESDSSTLTFQSGPFFRFACAFGSETLYNIPIVAKYVEDIVETV